MACAESAAAQTVTAFSMRLDNDILALRGRGAPPDYDYTHGLHIRAELGRNPGPLAVLQACAADGDALPCLRTRLHAGQEIYTPRRDAPTPLEGERPYAAWLYAGAEAVVDGPGRQRSLVVQMGVVGPAALGEPVQNGVHRLNGSQPQVGWAHQLGTEPGLLVRYRDERKVEMD
ncbi:MAG TPA: lipid A-modifier LpxR family protein, partial [Longimicrobium sp.]